MLYITEISRNLITDLKGQPKRLVAVVARVGVNPDDDAIPRTYTADEWSRLLTDAVEGEGCAYRHVGEQYQELT